MTARPESDLGPPPAVAIRGLTKYYGRHRAVDDLDLEVRAGEIVGFLGPNGAGKSTTIRILLDLIRPSAGTASICGHDCQRDGVAARAQSGYLPGELRLYDRWTGAEVVGLVTRLRRTPVDHDDVTALARRLDLDLSRRVDAYSKGNRQKLGLLLALAHRPRVVILDEPTSGLDPIRQRTIWALLRERADQGAAILLSSHVMSEVETVCDRVAVLRRGALLTVGSVPALLAMARTRLDIRFEGEPPRLGDIEGVHAVSVDDAGAVSLAFDGDPNALIRRLSSHRIAEIAIHPPRLDDVVLGLYEQGEAA